MNKTNKTVFLVRGSLIGALYVVLTLVASSVGLANGVIQIRFSEALCALPIIFPEASLGVTIGCLLSNIITGCPIPDIVFGTLATFLGAVLSFRLRKKRTLALLMPVLSNSIIIPFVLKYAYGLTDMWYILALSIFVGEFISCVLLGSEVLKIADKLNKNM